MLIFQISLKFSGLYINYPQYIGIHAFTVSSPWVEGSAFSAAEAIHTVPMFVSSRTHYCLVARGGV